MTIAVITEHVEKGWIASAPDLRALAQGETRDEAIENLLSLIRTYPEALDELRREHPVHGARRDARRRLARPNFPSSTTGSSSASSATSALTSGARALRNSRSPTAPGRWSCGIAIRARRSGRRPSPQRSATSRSPATSASSGTDGAASVVEHVPQAEPDRATHSTQPGVVADRACRPRSSWRRATRRPARSGSAGEIESFVRAVGESYRFDVRAMGPRTPPRVQSVRRQADRDGRCRRVRSRRGT